MKGVVPMQENKELTTADIVDDDAPLLPDGWKEGDDIFQEDSWSGGEDQSGQTNFFLHFVSPR